MVPAPVVLSVLLDLTQKFTGDLPLEDILLEVTEATVKLLPGDHASVRVFDESRSELLCGARSGTGAKAAPMSFKLGEGIVGWVAEHGRVAHSRDTEKDDRFVIGTENQGFTVRSIVAVPLLSAAKVVGVLSTSAPESSVFSAEDEVLLLLLANTTATIIEKARLERLAHVDGLTLAFNDRYLMPRLRDEVDRARRGSGSLSVLMLDLDRFRQVNQKHSFSVGDRMLRQLADRVRQFAGSRDRLVRRGGGTFVLLMPEADVADARSLAETIRSSLSQEALLMVDDQPLTQTASIGVAAWDGQENAISLIRRSEGGMKEAKRRGRNQVTVAAANESTVEAT